MQHFHIACVIGTRPEALKMAPVIEALRRHDHLRITTVLTGQHRELLAQVLKDFAICADVNFDVMAKNQTLGQLSAKLLVQFENFFRDHPCDFVIAQGDTTTTMIAALSAFYHHLPFAHVEAGLRTADIRMPFPEEFNRRLASSITTLHFCPTPLAAQNLAQEGITQGVTVTGNTIIDTLLFFARQVPPSVDGARPSILVTCHRRENFGEPLLRICSALKRIAQQHPGIDLVFPVHPNPNVRKVVFDQLAGMDNIQLLAPLDYQALVTALSHCLFVLTDSGGLQEEAPALNKPVLVLREETERPEGVHCGAAQLVGHDTQRIVDSVNALINNPRQYQTMSQAPSPYGDGLASQQIAQQVSDYLKGCGKDALATASAA